jgi:hypothetical protein
VSGFFAFVMINKNNNVESHASYPEELLKFFAAFRMTADNICRQSVFFAGDAANPLQTRETELHQKALPQNLL